MNTDITYLGSVQRVLGSKVLVELDSKLPSRNPIINGRVYKVGQIGSFVRISVGYLNLYGIVSMVGSGGGTPPGEFSEYPDPRDVIEIQLVGESYRSEPFQRGVGTYPTLNDEVHVVTEDDLSHIYSCYGEGNVEIGSLSASESLPAYIDVDKLVARHVAILGSTGSGKSNTVAAILKSLSGSSFPSSKIIIIDPHGEYGQALKGKCRVFRIGDIDNRLSIPYWALGFDELAWFLVERKSSSETVQDTSLREAVFNLKLESLNKMKQAAGDEWSGPSLITVDSPIPFDLRELWYRLDRRERVTYLDQSRKTESIISEGSARELRSAEFNPPGAGSSSPFKPSVSAGMGAYASKILGKLKDRRLDFITGGDLKDESKNDLDGLIGEWVNHGEPITILDLAGVPSEVSDLVVGSITKIIYEAMFWGRNLPGLGKQCPLLLVFEEAHSYIGKEGQFTTGYARRAVQRLMKEGRKYGVGAMIVSQRPSELDETILSQCGTVISLRLTNGNDQGRVKSCLPDELSGLTNLLPALRTGEAIISGEAVGIPSRVRVRKIEPRLDSSDPEVSREWSKNRSCNADSLRKSVSMWRGQA